VEHDGRFVVLGGYSGVERLDSVESFAVGDVETRVLTLLALLVHFTCFTRGWILSRALLSAMLRRGYSLY
jgi:hypothetical protein